MGALGFDHPIRLIARGAALLTVFLILSAQGAAPARADANCPSGHFPDTPNVGVTGSYGGTWTYHETDPQGPGNQDIAKDIQLTWSESLNGSTSACWTLNTLTGNASEDSGGSPSDCSATLSMASDAAANFSFDQTNSAGIGPFLDLQNPATGVQDSQNWYLQENMPYVHGDPEGVVQSDESDNTTFCYNPSFGYQPTNNTMFTGGGCHIGPYYSGDTVDFVSFPTHGGGSASDSCSYTTVANGDTITETLNQTATLTSVLPSCSDLSGSTTQGKLVTINLSCSFAQSQPLTYNARGTTPHGGSYSPLEAGSGAVRYLPAPGFIGTDSFTYTATPQGGLPSDPATVTVTVTKKKKKPKQPPKKPPPKPTGCGKGAKRGTTARAARARSMTLPRTYCTYLWVAAVDGRSSAGGISTVSWTQGLGVAAAPLRARGISIGRSGSQLGDFSSSAPGFGLAGVGIRGYKVVSTHSAVARGKAHRGKGRAAAPSLRIPGVKTSSGQLVLVLVGGQGTTLVSLSGLSARRLAGRTDVGSGSHATVGAWSASPAKGSHTVMVRTTVPATNSGTTVGAVVYVLGPS
jgi:hypothetical protein